MVSAGPPVPNSLMLNAPMLMQGRPLYVGASAGVPTGLTSAARQDAYVPMRGFFIGFPACPRLSPLPTHMDGQSIQQDTVLGQLESTLT